MSARRHFYKETVQLERFYRVCLELLQRSGAEAIRSAVPKFRQRAGKGKSLSIVDGALFHINRYLFELVLIRLVACVESFLIEAVRDVFLVDKKPFKIRSKKHEFTQDQLLGLSSVRELESLIIEKECRRLASGGYATIRDFFAKNLLISLDTVTKNAIRIEFYFDTRNALIHRLGATDNLYRRKHKTNTKFVAVDQDLVDEAFRNAKHFRLSLQKLLEARYFRKKNPTRSIVKEP
jgi:hypothetical protein